MDGEFTFLPETCSSRQAEELYRQAFPATATEADDDKAPKGASLQQDPLGSSIVVVLQRDDVPLGLTDRDREFVENELLPQLTLLKSRSPMGYDDSDQSPNPESREGIPELPPSEQIIRDILTPKDRSVGPLLTSTDQRAALIVLELKTEFLDRRNGLVVARLERLLESHEFLRQKPIGLVIALSGSATVGRDMLRAETESSARTELYTKVLVVILLLLIYRSPFLALVPLITVGVAVELTKYLLRLMADAELIGLFTGLEVYVTVVVYGAGVDYCLFLMARYKEELDNGATFKEAMARSITRVGAALATSAGTSIVGIGMMVAAEFGKFRQAGIAISFGLFVVLCFALTFTPSFLLLLGRWVFWPDIPTERLKSDAGWLPATTFWKAIGEFDLIGKMWDFISKSLEENSTRIFLATCLVMMPFAIVGSIQSRNLSYGLLTDLPDDEPSVDGARLVQQHFDAGVTGPATVLVKFPSTEILAYKPPLDENEIGFDDEDTDEPQVDLSDVTKSRKLSNFIVTNLKKVSNEFRIQDIRSQENPYGLSDEAADFLDRLQTQDEQGNQLRGPQRVLRINAVRSKSHRTYTSTNADSPVKGQVLRLDLVFEDDPFDRDSILRLSEAEKAVRNALPKELQQNAEILTLGPTSGIRDLKLSTDRDQITIDLLVVISVYIMLVMLLRRPAICAYLIVSVVFSYLVSLGATFLFFYLRDPSGFSGIDWKVPIYLFTILIAMGEDYNILLMSRIAEEQHEHGTIKGILIALQKTGSIISSCGIIMAGTFASLMSGSLLGMVQLGFALAFGVMLDTFVVRPILVPAYLIMLYRGQFGVLGKYLGAEASPCAMSFDDRPETDGTGAPSQPTDAGSEGDSGS
ncbi:MAG: MMPL family transporter [Planctomycetaceae bacterium]|nr:MMPL family transporter [Planctomycetaceae bacterium]